MGLHTWALCLHKQIFLARIWDPSSLFSSHPTLASLPEADKAHHHSINTVPPWQQRSPDELLGLFPNEADGHSCNCSCLTLWVYLPPNFWHSCSWGGAVFLLSPSVLTKTICIPMTTSGSSDSSPTLCWYATNILCQHHDNLTRQQHPNDSHLDRLW